MPVLERWSCYPDRLMFHCPGCKCAHGVVTEGNQQPVWSWNGDMKRPTFSPSVLVLGGEAGRCHLFVREGRLQFLADCHHELAGQTVDMVELES